MNITILSNHDLASNCALNQLLPALHGHCLTVFLSSRVGAARNLPQRLRDLMLVEQNLFNPLLNQPPPDRGSTPDNDSILLSFDALAVYLGSPITEFNNINTTIGLARLKASEPALIISLRYGVILQHAAISVPTLGVINLHSGLLPTYRGVMASFWGLLNGESQLGTTLHYINDASIDTGRIINTTRLRVNPEYSYLWHVLNLYPDGCALITATVERLAKDEPVDSHPQPQGGHYYSFPTASDLTRFSEQGLVLFDGDELATFLQRDLPLE